MLSIIKEALGGVGGAVPPIDFNNYGVDVTTPIHHYLNKENNPYFSQRYNDLMEGCSKVYSRIECQATELERLSMNLRKPYLLYLFYLSFFLLFFFFLYFFFFSDTFIVIMHFTLLLFILS
jgi:hypothetical protein